MEKIVLDRWTAQSVMHHLKKSLHIAKELENQEVVDLVSDAMEAVTEFREGSKR